MFQKWLHFSWNPDDLHSIMQLQLIKLETLCVALGPLLITFSLSLQHAYLPSSVQCSLHFNPASLLTIFTFSPPPSSAMCSSLPGMQTCWLTAAADTFRPARSSVEVGRGEMSDGLFALGVFAWMLLGQMDVGRCWIPAFYLKVWFCFQEKWPIISDHSFVCYSVPLSILLPWNWFYLWTFSRAAAENPGQTHPP